MGMDPIVCASPLPPTSSSASSSSAVTKDLITVSPPPPTEVLSVVRALSTQLTPLTDTLPPRLKRKWVGEASPPPSTKHTRTLRSSRNCDPSPAHSPKASLKRSPSPELDPIYTNRSFKHHSVPISPLFPLLYRRYPVSSFYAPNPIVSPLQMFNSSNPGGTYNAPRSTLDLYTPRFVRGKGSSKHGLCPICVEPHTRGGASRRVWLAMKFSAFKAFTGLCFTPLNSRFSYHMQYYHGISASTGRPFSPPIDFRLQPRPAAGKNQRTAIREAQCHKCTRWIPIEGIKAVDAKVKELFWWKHAAICHGTSSLDEPHDVYENDSVYTAVTQL